MVEEQEEEEEEQEEGEQAGRRVEIEKEMGGKDTVRVEEWNIWEIEKREVGGGDKRDEASGLGKRRAKRKRK